MSKRRTLTLILISTLLLVSCTKPTSTEKKSSPPTFEMVLNQGSYEAYFDPSAEEGEQDDSYILNLAFNHSSELKVDDQYVEEVKLLPETDIVSLDSFKIEENPPQDKLEQKALALDLSTQKPGNHTFTKISFKTKDGTKVLNLGEITVNVIEGGYSGIMVLIREFAVFPQSNPLKIGVRNDNDYPVRITGFISNNPNITFDKKDIIVNKDNKPFPAKGITLKPDEVVDLTVNWDVQFPPGETLNIEERALIVSEHDNKVEYIGVPNAIYRNDFSWGE